MTRKITSVLLFLAFAAFAFNGNRAAAQTVSGTVIDAKSGEPLPYVNVYYDGKGVGIATDTEGNFSVPYRKGWNILTVSSVGYKKMEIPLTGPITNLKVRLEISSHAVKEVSVKGRRSKYDRKNNPAVELMRKVIAAKKRSDLRRHDYFSYRKYEKRTLALNEFTEKVLEDEHFKKLPFLKERVETCPETGKLILPVSVDETYSRHIFKKEGNVDKTIIEGRKSIGLNEFFNTGDIMTTMLDDVFTDIDIYENNVHVLQAEFVSPLSSTSGISFYRYFIADTLDMDGVRCIEVTFTPNNSLDFGFNGSLYIMADSTYRVHKATLNLPYNNAVNFISDMFVSQQFETLPSGEQALANDNTIVQMSVIGKFTKFHVKQETYYSDYSTQEIPGKEFKFLGKERFEANAMMKDSRFWNSVRPAPLTETEDTMDDFLKKMESIKGFKFILFVAKAFIENFVETSTDRDKPSKVDIGPINTIISQNFVDGFRLRLSGQTTANLSPHLFAKGYAAYGFKDHKWKGMGEITYSFNKKAYLPREFPVNNLTVTYQYDDASPSDIFMPTDKDNVFTSFRWTKVNHMNYVEKFRIHYEREWENGFSVTAQLKRERDEATAALFYQRLDGEGTPSPDRSKHLRKFDMADIMLGLRFQPGATFINTKQRRIATNNDAPILELNHTMGIKDALGSDYTYNYTEAKVYKRFYLASWGRVDTYVKGGIQWNKVPFPLLIMPAANLSYIKERETFSLIDNMEFLNDRFVSVTSGWDMNGKIFNRIPLLRNLKWREYIGFNMLWGTLTNKNNPFLEKNKADSRLFYFPGEFRQDGSFKYQSRAMDGSKPYFEIIAGIHNIFKIFHVEYVRRLNYLDNPGTEKNGIRFMIRMTF